MLPLLTRIYFKFISFFVAIFDQDPAHCLTPALPTGISKLKARTFSFLRS